MYIKQITQANQKSIKLVNMISGLVFGSLILIEF